MKSIKYFIVFAAPIILLSCQKQLAEINKNPNAAENPQPEYLLTGAIKSSVDNYWGSAANYSAAQLITQQWARIQYTDVDRYIFTNADFSSVWSTILSANIHALNQIIAVGKTTGNNNYIGISHILRAWNFQLLTDVFGNVPYSQSDNIDQYPAPAYDKQQDVYHGLINELDAALSLLNAADGVVNGDVIYNGNTALWKKFANALKLRVALRIADREPDVAKQIVTQVLSNPAEIISNNTEIAQVVYEASPNWNPVAAIFSTREDSRVSATVVDRLATLNDPRLPIYADLPQDGGAYKGVANGLTNGDAAAYGLAKTSRPGAYFRADKAPAIIISYAEVLFLRAEAAARGFTTENAADLYKQAIIASFNQYGITNASVIDNYITQATVQYNAANYKKSIGEQKWIALFGQGLEAFTEWRRLDYPQLQPAAAGVLGGKIPVRFIYPGTEQTLNEANYKAAVAEQGTDNLLTKLWFDVN